MSDREQPCDDAEYGGRGEWECPTHHTTEDDGECPAGEEPIQEAEEGR